MPPTVDKSPRQQGAEAEVEDFREERGPFVVAAENTRMAMVFTDAATPGDPIIFANDSFLDLTGYAREEVLGQGFDFLIAAGTGAEGRARLAAAFDRADDAPTDKEQTEVAYRRKDGSEFWALILVSPVRDKVGVIVQHFASFVDLTRHKDNEAHARMLIDELNHRVKNTLATVQSIVHQALRGNPDPATIGAAIESRLFALSRSHDLLTQTNWASAGLDEVARAALDPFGVAAGQAERFIVSGPEVRLPPKAVLALGIAFHELATNAAKYGAFSNDSGAVSVDWILVPGSEASEPGVERLVIDWRERGGPPVSAPKRRGLGSRVLERGLAHEMGGDVQIDYRPEGLACTIDVPAPVPAPALPPTA